jgi:hypothetical protein
MAFAKNAARFAGPDRAVRRSQPCTPPQPQCCAAAANFAEASATLPRRVNFAEASAGLGHRQRSEAGAVQNSPRNAFRRPHVESSLLFCAARLEGFLPPLGGRHIMHRQGGWGDKAVAGESIRVPGRGVAVCRDLSPAKGSTRGGPASRGVQALVAS